MVGATKEILSFQLAQKYLYSATNIEVCLRKFNNVLIKKELCH